MNRILARWGVIAVAGTFAAGVFGTTAFADAQPSTDENLVIAEHSGLCLDVKGHLIAHGTPVVQATCRKTNNQLWWVHPKGDGFYEISADHSGRCLDVAHQSKAQAAPVVQADCWSGPNQLWSLRPAGSTDPARIKEGFYQLVAKHSGMCLDVAHLSIAHAAPVIQAKCWDGPNQHWAFVRPW